MNSFQVRMPKLVVAVFTVLALCGCGGQPSPSEGRKELERQIQAQSNGLIKLVSFDKTNGVNQEVQGMSLYEMDFTAEIEFLDDCIWDGEQIYTPMNFRAQRGERSVFNIGWKKAGKGQHKKVNGQFMFQSTEQGWRIAK